MQMLTIAIIITVLILAWHSYSKNRPSDETLVYRQGRGSDPNPDPDSDADMQEQYSYYDKKNQQ